MLKAAETSASFDSLAKLLGISRRTLYRWQETVGVKQDPEGD
jgi:predicted DNA-binding transcriptional regulator YafY